MGKFHCPVFSIKTIYLDFKAQRNALYHCHGNIIVEENVTREIYDGYFNWYRIHVCLFFRKKEKLFRASLIYFSFLDVPFLVYHELLYCTVSSINIDYFMVGECVRFLFTSCEGSRKRMSERSERVSLTILHNEWVIKIVQTSQSWSNLFII